MRVAILGAPGSGKTALARALRDQDWPDFSAVALLPSPTAVGSEQASSQPSDRPGERTSTLPSDPASDGPADARPGLLLCDAPPLAWVLAGAADAPAFGCVLLLEGGTAPTLGLRQTLSTRGLAYASLHGPASAQQEQARSAILHALRAPRHASQTERPGSWQWCCDSCSDAACEHRLFSALLADKA